MFYSKVKELCKEKGISVRKLESDLEFSFGSICKWDINLPSFDRVEKVANYFSISLDYFKGVGESV